MDMRLRDLLEKMFPRDRLAVEFLDQYLTAIQFDPHHPEFREEEIDQLVRLLLEDFIGYRIDSDRLAHVGLALVLFIGRCTPQFAGSYAVRLLLEIARLSDDLRFRPCQAAKTLHMSLQFLEKSAKRSLRGK